MHSFFLYTAIHLFIYLNFVDCVLSMYLFQDESIRCTKNDDIDGDDNIVAMELKEIWMCCFHRGVTPSLFHARKIRLD